MQLIYRGYIFDYTPRTVEAYHKPRALNWRWHSPSEKFEYTPRPMQPYHKPRALNWRFELPARMQS
jgi:hypothetical protein